ncbi:MAG: amidohydrolase [Acidobacteria bacterium]|nr:amidohydrolase [Acidobacteriota bacterium]
MRRSCDFGRLLLACAALFVAAGVAAEEGVLVQEIAAVASEIEPQLIEARRWFHQHPELSNREEQTGREIARRLEAMGYGVQTGVAGHGVVAVLEGANPGPVVAWRADIDALPIEEEVDVPYRSANPGVMHACGHDLHTTVGLGVAEVLMRLRDRVHGTVKFIFQPAEEGPPAGEEGGARLMIAEGVLRDPAPDAIFGLHVMPTLEAGTVGWRAGGLMAAADRFRLRILGQMTHGSAPEGGIDAVYVASQVVNALQSISSREVDARRSLVISVGSFNAGSRWNIIAGEALLTGTVRTLDDETWAAIPDNFERVVAGICEAHGARYELEYHRIAPVTINDASLTSFAASSLKRSLGPEQALEVEPIMASEDFAYFQRELPGVYFFLGVANSEEGWTDYVHTPTFRPDESAIVTGVTAAATLLTDFTAADLVGRSD